MSKLTKCINTKDSRFNFYCKSEKISENEEYNLVGFKDSLAVVIRKIMENRAGVNKKLLLVEVDPKSGEKFINLNGRKLKMVPQSLIPESVLKSTNLLKANKNIDLQVSLNVDPISKTSQLQSTVKTIKNRQMLVKKVNSNGTDKNLEIDKKHLIYPNRIKTHNLESNQPIASSVDSDTVKTLNDVEHEYMKTDVSTTATESGRMEMEALNLTKIPRRISDEQTEVSRLVDKCIQTDKDLLVNTESQTDDLNSIDWDSTDLIKFIDENISSVIGLPGTVDMMPAKNQMHNMQNNVSSKLVNNMNNNDPRRRMFFMDLRSCLTLDNNGNLPIHEGIIKNDMQLVKRMVIVLHARGETVNLGNHNGCTPLQLAIIHNSNPEIVKVLLENNADLTDIDGDGNSIIHMAVQYERKTILEQILQQTKDTRLLNAFNFDGLTPLMICCSSSLYECALLLIQFGADVNVKDQKSGRTALFYAAECHDVDMVKLLLENNADTKVKNFFGTSPHDAMYEVEEIPKPIKSLILGKFKRKATDTPEPRPVPKKILKTYPKYQKISKDLPFIKKMSLCK